MKEMNEYREIILTESGKNLLQLCQEKRAASQNCSDKFTAEDSHNTEKQWKSLRDMNDEKEINVDKAWNKVHVKDE